MTMHSDEYVVDFQVLAFGLVYASVCTSLSEEETTARLNLVHPTGLAYSCNLTWQPSTDDRFAAGQSNPCKCELRPDTHEHRLYSC